MADRQFSKRVESGQCPTDEAIAAAYARCCSSEEAAKLLGVSVDRFRSWANVGPRRGARLAIGPVAEARKEYERVRRLELSRTHHEKRRARIKELEAEIEQGIEAQKKAQQQLMQSANMYRSELIHAVEDAKGTAPKKAARAQKRILRKCSEYVQSCAGAHVDLPAHEDDPGA